MPPSSPNFIKEITPIITKAIWTTLEYAITTFKSLCRIQTILKIAPPIKANLIIIKDTLLQLINLFKRKRPYPPSFNKIPAKIIEPETGASTCALGNHKWKKNRKFNQKSKYYY